MAEPVSGLDAIEKATSKLPVARYAWGVVALIAVVAFASYTGIGYGYAVLGGLVVFALMVMFLIFQVADKINHEHLQTPARILIYFVLAVFMAVSVLLLTSVFANWPLPIKDMMFLKATPADVSVVPGAPVSTDKDIDKEQPDGKQPEEKTPDNSARIEQLPYKGDPIKTDDGPIEVQKGSDDSETTMPTNHDDKTKPQFQ